jgi:hypothetical protein
MVDQDGLVAWPGGAEWVDSGDGGLFAYLVWRTVATPDRARVDVFPCLTSTTMTFPEALLRQLWAPPRVERPAVLNGEGPLHPWSRPLRAVAVAGVDAAGVAASGDGRAVPGVPGEPDAGRVMEVAHCLDHVYRTGRGTF